MPRRAVTSSEFARLATNALPLFFGHCDGMRILDADSEGVRLFDPVHRPPLDGAAPKGSWPGVERYLPWSELSAEPELRTFWLGIAATFETFDLFLPGELVRAHRRPSLPDVAHNR